MKRCSECHGEFQDTVDKCPTDNSELEAEHVNPLIGSCLAGRYQILEMLGSGGAGVVYKAQHLKMDRAVAVKMMHAHMMSNPEKIKNFCDEARTIAQLKHHNIVLLYDFGISESNQPYLVMDYIDGPSLKKYTETFGPIPMDHMRLLVSQIVDGLAYAHSEGIVHQDLKPENIILSNLGRPGTKATIVDFGLATLSMTDKDMAMSGNKKKKFIGSPYYMSPEQCLTTVMVDSRSDIYSLAIVLYEALSDKLPFERKSAMAMMDSHVREIPLAFKNCNSDLAGLNTCTELTNVFHVAMAKEPDSRYQTISEFGAELDDALARDGAKVKAIKHRNLAAEQVLVQVSQSLQGNQTAEVAGSDAGIFQLGSGTEFLSRQAEIEQALLGSARPSSPEIPVATKENIINNLLNKIGQICLGKNHDKEVQSAQQEVECPNCKSILKPGIQFCLNCQRTVSAPIRTNKLSEARYHPSEAPTLDEQQKAKDKLQKLRQNKLVTLAKAQQLLNYALIAALIIGGIMIVQRYMPTSKHTMGDNSFKNTASRPASINR